MSKIVFIGSGNVATQLGLALKSHGHTIAQVCSPHRAGSLAKKLSAQAVRDASNVSADADIYIIAVKDDAIPEVVKKMPKLSGKVVIHTSGATGISILRKKFPVCGVIWQVQTIRVRTKVDFRQVPLVIEASNASALKKLRQLARQLSPIVHMANSKQRRVLHLSAVWINNFPNHLYYLGKKLLEKHGLPFELFGPLMLSTTLSGMKDPKAAQTGPAKRNDRRTMSAHLALLSDRQMRKIYLLLSDSITRAYRK